MEKLLTTGEVSKISQFSVPTVLSWINRGWLKSYNTAGGHNRVSLAELYKFLKERNMYIPDDIMEILENPEKNDTDTDNVKAIENVVEEKTEKNVLEKNDIFIGGDKEPNALIVDNNEKFRGELSCALEKEGYLTFTAADSRRANLMIKEMPFSLIILDYFMSGIYIPEILKANNKNKARLVVMLDYTDLAAVNELAQLGISEVFLKPEKIDSFINIFKQDASACI